MRSVRKHSLMLPGDWGHVLRTELEAPYFRELLDFVQAERAQHAVFPPEDEVFRALELTPCAQVRVVLLGQDPYHDVGQAHGLCFSVRDGVKPPPSLANVFKELVTDIGGPLPASGCLEGWARQGVLLLNTVLTVRAHQAHSHRRQGWERLTDAVIEAVSAKPEHVVFLLWGAPAQKKQKHIDTSRHTVLKAPHPSPLSAHTGFFGSHPFSKTNDALQSHGQPPIDWRRLGHQ